MAIVSTAKFSDTIEADRLDAEFFEPKDLEILNKLRQAGGSTLGEICDVLNGKTPTEYIADGDVPVVRSGDLSAPLIYPDCGRDFLRTQRSEKLVRLVTGDVLISSIGLGSIGKISLVMDAGDFVTVSEVTILRSRKYPSEVLFTYLTTEAGQRQILRQVTGATGQQHLLRSKVEMILVPPAPKRDIVDAIRASCARAWDLEKDVSKQHIKTHEIFANSLGL
jgi:type I restriction enzyme M protein